MYAIAFDLKIDTLKKEYGDPYNWDLSGHKVVFISITVKKTA